jgi:uncharacterized protein YecE (DUF72 family)
MTSPRQESFGFIPPTVAPERRIEPIALGAGRIYVGTCGYSYKDWIGPFYPAGIKPSSMLSFYAEHFAAVEIDASYYAILPPATFASMAARTPDDFRFAVKLPGTLTHLPLEAATGASDDAALFRESVEPLRAAGKLTSVLMQFPNGFRPDARAEAYVRALGDALADLPLVAEFRNREWQRPQTLALLAEADIAWCNVDEPQFEDLMRPSSDVIGTLGYVRFHGRNFAKWWRHESGDERYDYLYTAEELTPWTERVAEMAGQTTTTLAFFNNHRFGQAAKNADMFAHMLVSLPGFV